jgi:putative OmpL-like beta-barrel porin-2
MRRPAAVRGACVSIALATMAGAGPISSPPVSAQEAPTAAGHDAPWWEQIALDGFVSTTYSYNFNRPADRINRFRVFDFDDNTFKIDVAELVVQKAAAGARDAGFRVDLVAGGSIPRVSSATGLFRDSSEAEDFDLQQAFVSYVAPVGRGLRFDFGKFVTHHGYEVIEGYDGYNDNASRSFLFGFAIPFTHTGAKASYAYSDRLSGALMVVNGWDNARDNNRSKSVGAQLAFVPAAALNVYLNGMYGPERDGNDSDARTMADLVAIWKPASRATLGVNWDYGSEENAAGPGADAVWTGIAAYARLGLTARGSIAVRGEFFDDRDGTRTGQVQRLKEVTWTPEFQVAPHFVLRGDLRVDWSDSDVFLNQGDTDDTQTTILLNALFAF